MAARRAGTIAAATPTEAISANTSTKVIGSTRGTNRLTAAPWDRPDDVAAETCTPSHDVVVSPAADAQPPGHLDDHRVPDVDRLAVLEFLR